MHSSSGRDPVKGVFLQLVPVCWALVSGGNAAHTRLKEWGDLEIFISGHFWSSQVIAGHLSDRLLFATITPALNEC